MTEDEILSRLEKQEKTLAEIKSSMDKLKSYFRWTFILTVVFFVLPLIGIIILIPIYLKTLNFGSLGL